VASGCTGLIAKNNVVENRLTERLFVLWLKPTFPANRFVAIGAMHRILKLFSSAVRDRRL
jgi:hypothetical protein